MKLCLTKKRRVSVHWHGQGAAIVRPSHAHSVDVVASCVDSASDMDIDAIGNDFRVPQPTACKAYEVEHESLSQLAVEKLMADDIEHICGIFGINVSTVFLCWCLR